MIRLQNITISRGGVKLFEQFNLDIGDRQHYVIQGSNGSGKTMLLQLIAGKITPTSGVVTYDFIQSPDWTEKHSLLNESIQYIPSHALQTFLGGYPNLFYQQRYYSIGDEQSTRVKDVFGDALPDLASIDFPRALQIEHLLELDLLRLSNGQLKKVLILQGLVRGMPRLLLLDYPFEGLDRESRAELCDFIDQIANRFNIQVMLTDHHHELPAVINRKLVLDKFRIKTIGPVSHDKQRHNFEKDDSETRSSMKRGTESVVELKNVSIQYGTTKVVENLDWRINRGERWALTGRNGSGKTTLFGLIYADHPMAYSQKVFLFGRRRGTGESIWDIKKRINYLGPEQLHFMSPGSINITVQQYLTDSVVLNGGQSCRDLVAFFEVADLMKLPVRCLSSGQLQLMLLLRFFLADKELLLLDEPFQFLDPWMKTRVNEYMSHYLKPDATLILITHYEEDLQAWTQLRKSL